VLTAPGTEVWAATNLDATAGELDSTIALGGTSATAATAPFSIGSTLLAWFPVTSADGTHETFRLAARTGWCLEATTAAVTAQACTGATSQEFTFSSEVGGDGISYLQLKAAVAPGFCVSAGTGSGTVPVTLASCVPGVSSQMWYVYSPLQVLEGLADAPRPAARRSPAPAGSRHHSFGKSIFLFRTDGGSL
jgi:hypothetical protein